MTAEYSFYHGSVLHELIVTALCEVRIQTRDVHGRPDAFTINDDVGLLIKHSTARLTPWIFTFTKEHLAELSSLRIATRVCFVALVCGEDGVVCIRDSDIAEIRAQPDSNVVSVRVDRRPRKMYRVSSSGNPLDRKVAKGVQEIIDEICLDKKQLTAAASN